MIDLNENKVKALVDYLGIGSFSKEQLTELSKLPVPFTDPSMKCNKNEYLRYSTMEGIRSQLQSISGVHGIIYYYVFDKENIPHINRISINIDNLS